ncbi:MAG: hypothetical protein VYD40_02510 [Chloroflexota bacterium]|jgi:hypothetical protein|nr:hypothetical protein [Chloroflexota bacterium]|tara:strand:+ start:598 stop:1053 length:456 start_codon:yes stop_codon:yes gene_type:complete
MIKRVVQIIVLLLPFLAFLIFSSCADPQPIDDEFKVTKDMNLIEETLFEKKLYFIEHRRTSNQQFSPSESELNEPRFIIDNFPKINEKKDCNEIFYEIKNSMRNYPLFIINEKNEVLAYLVKFRNTTGILSANQQNIPVILLEDFEDYFGC